jgi:AraC-like DNA-binding protein
MAVVFRPAGAPVADRIDAWQQLLHETVGPLEPHGVPDEVRAGELGAVRVAELSQAAPGGAVRTARHVRRSDSELYKVDVLARGRGVIEQDGRQAALEQGDLTFVDLSRPARWAMAPSVRCLAFVFPPAMLPLPRDELARLTAVRIAADEHTGALASSFARQVAGRLDNGGGTRGARLGTAALDLLAVALAARLDRAEELPPESRQRALVLRMRAFIEEHLGDPDLTPRTVAAAHYVSVRYLHKLFETEQTTVAEWIRHRRLERCRRDLLDPALRALPVNAIAARWGLLNAAHFSRAFRAAYGAAPIEYRRLTQPPG